MITYERLLRTPKAFPALTGLCLEEFDRLLGEVTAADRHRAAATTATKDGRPRRRAAGAGRHPDHDLRDRLLMALFWLRVYPSYSLLGWLFGLDKANAWRNVQNTLALLDTLPDFPFDRPTGGRKKVRAAAALFEEFPEVRLIVDAKEQPFRRPDGWDNQKAFYSGKRKQHTLKYQVGVTPEGRVGSVSVSVPGGVHDLTLLRGSGLLDRLGEGEGVMTDKAYLGADEGRPGLRVVLPCKRPPKGELSPAQKGYNRRVSRRRVKAEHVLAQFSRFAALRQRFRGLMGRHSRAVRAVALLVDRRIETNLKGSKEAG
jgi:DDE superfamily endonuclease/Helix-turn-helix of DDE superfamily endonuclease